MHILYHNSCPDGWCAAYIALKKYPSAKLMPLNHGLNDAQLNDLFAAVRGEDVLMLDYSLRTRELNDALNQAAKTFRILDHHKTAEAVLAGAGYATFDMKRSGAGITFDYLFGKDSQSCHEKAQTEWCDHSGPGDFMGHTCKGGSRPWYVDYVEDMDLWNWKLKDSKIITAFLMASPRNEVTWDFIHSMKASDALRLGEGIRTQVDYYTRSVVAEKQEGILPFEGRNYRTAVLNIPYAGVSEAGNALCKEGYEIGLAWFERGDGQIQFSLRSEGDIDISPIAKYFGGGGHAHAAGFQVTVAKGRAIVDEILGRGGYALPTPTPRPCVK